MGRFVARGLLGTALALALGLHWALLQGVAWTGMLVRYSQEAPLTEAFSRTFDGEHPCALCRMVAEGRSADRRSPMKSDGSATPSVPRLEALPGGSCPDPWCPPVGRPCGPSLSLATPASRDEAPPVPPPRALRRV